MRSAWQSNEIGVADQTTDRLVNGLADRLVDIALERISASLYRARNLRVTTIMEDMVDFFTY